MSALPILTHAHPTAIVARRAGYTVPAGEFLADVQRVQQTLPAGGHVLNACSDRYQFTVALVASLLAGKITLLPATHTPEMIWQVQQQAPDVFCLCDQPSTIALPQHHYPVRDALEVLTPVWPAPTVPQSQTVAWVFTSGSTGTPVAHPKTWGALVRNVQAGAALLGYQVTEPLTIIGTVPPQHMYGFESTVWSALQNGHAIWAGHPFYPSDIRAALEAVPAPRWLVTTPVHLRALLTHLHDAGETVSTLQGITSATAPLSQPLAQEAEQVLHTLLFEIYGSTETGQIAIRRSAKTQTWRLFAGIQLNPADDSEDPRLWASGGHIEQAVPMNDVIERLSDGSFMLHGRMADLINIAGKRNSLAYLNQQLTQIEGVLDGTFYMPDDDKADGVTRLTAFVVAPQLSSQQILQALRERLDPVFLPRPLYHVSALPRNTTGKLPREALQHLAQACKSGTAMPNNTPVPSLPKTLSFTVPAQHPAFPGHFPSAPIVPGVVLLDHALLALAQACGQDDFKGQIATAKFLNPVQPDETVTLLLEAVNTSNQQYRFNLAVGARKVATGQVQWSTVHQQ